MPVNDSNLQIYSSQFRENLLGRNLYSIDNNYPYINDSSLNKMVNSVNSIIDAIMPFKGFDLNTSIYNSILNYDNQTPLVKISLNMLSKQMALNETSHIMQQNFPIFNVTNLFDNNSNTDFITFKKDMKITSNDKTNKTFNEKLKSLSLNNINEALLTDYTNNTLIENTGKGQLSIMLNLLSKNKYKPISEIYQKKSEELNITNYTSKGNSTYNYNNDDNSYTNELGYTEKKSILSYDTILNNDNISNNLEIHNDLPNNENKIVWGRDGFNGDNSKNYLKGSFNDLDTNIYNDNDFEETFNVKQSGILSNTRTLVNEGKIKNLTNKLFEENNGSYGFNGSGIWKSNDSDYAEKSGISNKTGIRQHNAIDQYDKFTKLIRFNGNQVYGGNKNSVIHKSVIPSIFPTIEDKKFNTKNLMFSIENLAFNVSEDGSVTNDINGQKLPKYEIGPNKGRIMWFPPYGIDIQETANAKFESTVTVGRNEPMYNYISSERSATLSFILLMDYPSQLKNYINSPTAQKDITEFFLFGGDKVNNNLIVNNIDKQINDIENQMNKFITNDTVSKLSFAPNIPSPISIYYPNNMPNDGQKNNIIDIMYKYTYEVDTGFYSDNFNTFGNLNKSIYYINKYDIIINDNNFQTIKTDTDTNQYNNNVARSNFDRILYNLFNFENSESEIKIKLTSSASKLYHDGNKELCNRRNEAAKIFILSRFINLFPNKDSRKLDIIFVNNEDNYASDIGIYFKNAYKPIVKLDRKTTIEFLYVPKTNTNELQFRNSSDKEKYNELSKQKTELETIKSNYNNNPDILFNERTITTDAILRGYKSIKDNHYYPGLHTQTPEDFHRRLTFLHQCVRQGGSKNYDNNKQVISKNSVFGKQPICILRIGDFFYSKIIIDSINFDYSDATWDLNPEGFGLQPMLAKITLNIKVIGGQSLKGPISIIQNALSFNYYANSTFTNEGIYEIPSKHADTEYSDKSQSTIIPKIDDKLEKK